MRLFGRQPTRDRVDGARLHGIGGAVDAIPQARFGEQPLIVRRAQYRIAGAGQLGFAPQRGEIAIEIELRTLAQLRLQRVAGQRIAETRLIHGEKIVPVLPACEFGEEVATQVAGGDEGGITLEIILDLRTLDLADVVGERGRFQIRIERIVLQTAGRRAPAVAALLGRGVGLLERGALRFAGLGGGSRADQPQGGRQGEQAAGDSPRCCVQGHDYSLCQDSRDEGRSPAGGCAQRVTRKHGHPPLSVT